MSVRNFFYLVFVLLINFFPEGGYALQLKERLLSAEPGDFMVISYNRVQTFWYINAVSPSKARVSEITFPENIRPSDWYLWLEKGAPGHLTWIDYVIDINKGEVESLFSRDRGTYLQQDSSYNLLGTLFKLQFFPIPIKEQKKVGPKPALPLKDTRPCWQPPVLFKGKKIEIPLEAWKTVWPVDGSELAGKELIIYLPQEKTTIPNYFPYWLQVSNNVAKLQFRVIDSGRK